MSPLNNPMVWLLLLAIGSCVVWIVSDNRALKSLGKGAVPYNFCGCLMAIRFRPAKREPFGTEIFNDRIGVHPVPHRQLDQFAEENIRQQLEHLFGSFIAANHRHVRFAKSFYEKRNDAVTLIDPDHSHALAKISHGEAAHIHPEI